VKAFITGGAGVIGRELVNRLYAAGHHVSVCDREVKPSWMPEGVVYYQEDVNSLGELPECDTIFHLAASFERSEETPEHYEPNFHDNVRSAHHVFRLALRDKPRVVFASSYLVYDPGLYIGHEKPYALTESEELYARNLTGASKLYTETELRYLAEVHGLAFSAARIFRSYGIGSRDVISRWVRLALRDQPIEVYGTHQSFDYVYAGDVADGLIRLAVTDTRGFVNLGTGVSRKVSDILMILKTHFPKLDIRPMSKVVTPEASVADMTDFKKFVGWKPRTTLELGIAKIVEYERGRV
jgi:nucleoside-diphosphate-sugar epimerase